MMAQLNDSGVRAIYSKLIHAALENAKGKNLRLYYQGYWMYGKEDSIDWILSEECILICETLNIDYKKLISKLWED
jgi:hypothetical protein